MTRFLFERQQLPDGSMPRNSLTNGKLAPDSFNIQLDECAYPLVMALASGLTSRAYYTEHIRPAANFVATHGPAYGPERWEEQDGYSPSTIAAEIAGLLAAARIADLNGDRDSAAVWRGVADEFQRNLKPWTLTTNGPYGTYFIRLSKTGDPNAAIAYNVGNGGPTLDQRAVIDAGFLEYARLGLMRPDDPDIVRSLAVVDAQIKRTTASGEGFLSLQRRRLRRPLVRRPSVGALQPGQRPPVAGAGGRARPVGDRPGPDVRRGRARAGDGEHGLRRRADRRSRRGSSKTSRARRSGPTRSRPRSGSRTASPPAAPRR